MPEYSAAKPYGIGLPLSPEEIVELKMIVQDEDAEGRAGFRAPAAEEGARDRATPLRGSGQAAWPELNGSET